MPLLDSAGTVLCVALQMAVSRTSESGRTQVRCLSPRAFACIPYLHSDQMLEDHVRLQFPRRGEAKAGEEDGEGDGEGEKDCEGEQHKQGASEGEHEKSEEAEEQAKEDEEETKKKEKARDKKILKDAGEAGTISCHLH